MRPLSQREREILHWWAEGVPNEQIALIRRRSYWTIRNQTRSIMAKLRATSQTEAVIEAYRKGLVW